MLIKPTGSLLRLGAVLGLTALAGAAGAQSAALEGLTVHGHAELKVRPDVAFVTLGVSTQAHDQRAASQANAAKTKAVLDTLRKSGILAKDIQTQDYSVQSQYNEKAKPPALVGYQVVNTLAVTLRNLGKAGVIVDKATQAGANQVGDLTFDLADRGRAEGEVLTLAIANARAKADLMAGAADVALGRMLSLSEGTSTPIPMSVATIAPAVGDQAAVTPVAAGQITVTADVVAVYALESAGRSR